MCVFLYVFCIREALIWIGTMIDCSYCICPTAINNETQFLCAIHIFSMHFTRSVQGVSERLRLWASHVGHAYVRLWRVSVLLRAIVPQFCDIHLSL